MNIGENVRQRRTALGKSTIALGRETGVTGQMITMIEMGHRRPSLVLAMKLAEALGCTLSELVGQASA